MIYKLFSLIGQKNISRMAILGPSIPHKHSFEMVHTCLHLKWLWLTANKPQLFFSDILVACYYKSNGPQRVNETSTLAFLLHLKVQTFWYGLSLFHFVTKNSYFKRGV